MQDELRQLMRVERPKVVVGHDAAELDAAGNVELLLAGQRARR